MSAFRRSSTYDFFGSVTKQRGVVNCILQVNDEPLPSTTEKSSFQELKVWVIAGEKWRGSLSRISTTFEVLELH